MALATRCPHCLTTFRVANDQLKLRAGLVRCGSCKEIFNGAEHLLLAGLPPRDASPQDSAVAPSAAVAPDADKDAVQALDQERPALPEQRAAPASQIPSGEDEWTRTPIEHVRISGAASTDVNADPLQRMTLMDFSSWKEDDEDEAALQESSALPIDDPDNYSQTEQVSDAPDELDSAIEDLQRRPWRRKRKKRDIDDEIEGDEDATEPDFVRRARRQQQIGRTMHVLAGVGSALLLITLIAQSVYTFRNQIAGWLPQATPMLVEVCARIGCDVGFPTQIDAVSIESSELQTLVPNQNTFVLNTLLRNRSSTAQAWPSIELTLNDANEKPIARRVFSPREYLAPANDMKKGFDANSEQPARVFFDLSELKASGYRVYLFYP